MSLKLGNTAINKLYLGNTEAKKVYLGSTLVHDKSALPGIVQLWPTNIKFAFSTWRSLSSLVGASSNITAVRNTTTNAAINITPTTAVDGSTITGQGADAHYNALYDQSGNANNALQTNTADPPNNRATDGSNAKYVTATGGYPALFQFSNSGNFALSTPITLTGVFTISLVTESVDAVPISSADISDYFRNENATTWRLTINSTNNVATVASNSALRHVLFIRDSANDIKIYVNGVLRATHNNSGAITVERVFRPVAGQSANRQTELVMWEHDWTSELANIYAETRAAHGNNF